MVQSTSNLLSWEGHFKRYQDEYLYDYASNINKMCWEDFKKEMLEVQGVPMPAGLKDLDADRYRIFVDWFENSKYFFGFSEYVRNICAK